MANNAILILHNVIHSSYHSAPCAVHYLLQAPDDDRVQTLQTDSRRTLSSILPKGAKQDGALLYMYIYKYRVNTVRKKK